MITKDQYEFLKERLKDTKQDKLSCTAGSTYSGDDLVCDICPLWKFKACPCTGQKSIDKIIELMKEYEEVNMDAKGFEITEEDYEFLKRRKINHDNECGCDDDADCGGCILEKYENNNDLDYCSCCPSGAEFMTAYTALTEQYEKENGIKKEDKMKNESENKTAKKYNESDSEIENYYDRLQRYYKKDFRPGDRVFVKPQDDCMETVFFKPAGQGFGKIATILNIDCHNGELLFYGKLENNIDTEGFVPKWLLPVVSPEDAYRAMLDGKQITSNEGYVYSKKIGAVHYDFETKCFVVSDDEYNNESLGNVEFIILDDFKLTVTRQEIADKFGVNIKDLIIED